MGGSQPLGSTAGAQPFLAKQPGALPVTQGVQQQVRRGMRERESLYKRHGWKNVLLFNMEQWWWELIEVKLTLTLTLTKSREERCLHVFFLLRFSFLLSYFIFLFLFLLFVSTSPLIISIFYFIFCFALAFIIYSELMRLHTDEQQKKKKKECT